MLGDVDGKSAEDQDLFGDDSSGMDCTRWVCGGDSAGSCAFYGWRSGSHCWKWVSECERPKKVGVAEVVEAAIKRHAQARKIKIQHSHILILLSHSAIRVTVLEYSTDAPMARTC